MTISNTTKIICNNQYKIYINESFCLPAKTLAEEISDFAHNHPIVTYTLVGVTGLFLGEALSVSQTKITAYQAVTIAYNALNRGDIQKDCTEEIKVKISSAGLKHLFDHKEYFSAEPPIKTFFNPVNVISILAIVGAIAYETLPKTCTFSNLATSKTTPSACINHITQIMNYGKEALTTGGKNFVHTATDLTNQLLEITNYGKEALSAWGNDFATAETGLTNQLLGSNSSDITDGNEIT